MEESCENIRSNLGSNPVNMATPSLSTLHNLPPAPTSNVGQMQASASENAAVTASSTVSVRIQPYSLFCLLSFILYFHAADHCSIEVPINISGTGTIYTPYE